MDAPFHEGKAHLRQLNSLPSPPEMQIGVGVSKGKPLLYI